VVVFVVVFCSWRGEGNPRTTTITSTIEEAREGLHNTFS
jgi:hypothetical protein